MRFTLVHKGKDIEILKYNKSDKVVSISEYPVERKVIFKLNANEEELDYLKTQIFFIKTIVSCGICVYNSYIPNILNVIKQRKLCHPNAKKVSPNFKFSKAFRDEIYKRMLSVGLIYLIYPTLNTGYYFMDIFIGNQLQDDSTSPIDFENVTDYINYLKLDSSIKLVGEDAYIKFPSRIQNKRFLNLKMFNKNQQNVKFNDINKRSIKIFPDSRDFDKIESFFAEFRVVDRLTFPNKVKRLFRCVKVWYDSGKYFVLTYDIDATIVKFYDITDVIKLYKTVKNAYDTNNKENLYFLLGKLDDIYKMVYDRLVYDILHDGVTELYFVGHSDLIWGRAKSYRHPFRDIIGRSDIEYLSDNIFNLIRDAIENTWVTMYYGHTKFKNTISLKSDIGSVMNSYNTECAIKRDCVKLYDYEISVNVYNYGRLSPVGFVGLCYDLRDTKINNRIGISHKRSFIGIKNISIYKLSDTKWEFFECDK